MRARYLYPLLLLAALVAVPETFAQSGTAPVTVPESSADDARPKITLADYVKQVLDFNLDLAAQRGGLAVTRATVTTAKARPDWSLDIGLPTVDVSGQGNPLNFGTGVTAPIELGGKRGARVRAATGDVDTAGADYNDAVRQLRATAAGAFVDALSARSILESKRKSLAQFNRLVVVNEERLRAGDIGEIELIQSRVDRDQFRATEISAEADVISADLAMVQLMGDPKRLSGNLPVPNGTLDIPGRTFEPDQLVAHALETRSDVLSRKHALRTAEWRIELAQVNLIPDVSVSGSYSHLATGTGGFVQPADNTFGAGLSVNLPFSRWRNRGELEGARAARTQAEIRLRSTELAVETEVRTAVSTYSASVKRLELYRGGLLKDADRVLEAKLYAYQRGSATLLEVIDAQRTAADVYLSYAQALTDHAHALVDLQQAANLNDQNF